ncbi:MAG: L-fucose/L-arabinose isomerase family protein [Kiritimatiellia bacterium]
MQNIPQVKLALVGVSRNCFPMELTRARMAKVVEACRKAKVEIIACETIIETEKDAIKALAELRSKHVNALAIYLGNFGPEGPMTILAREFGGPFMLCAAAEESAGSLIDGRGDAYCGMLNASLNCGLRRLQAHIPDAPVGSPDQVAAMLAHFTRVARVVIGVRKLKAITFGPRPEDFYACNAPIQPLYDLGVEVMENSELDLLQIYQQAASQKKRIEETKVSIKREVGASSFKNPAKLQQLAQFEVALTDFVEKNLGSREFAVLADKCWPAFESAFGFVPCYINSRLTARGLPVACEVDIYGAVSEYMAQCASMLPVTLLDVNNTVPDDLAIEDLKGATRADLFMGFHCGNTAKCNLCEGCSLKYQLIMHRLMEPGKEPDITWGTLEGTLKPGEAMVFRVQATGDNHLQAYMAEGHILDADPHSFGGIGIFGMPNFARFYRHVLIGKQYPHHTAVAWAHAGRVLFDALLLLGVKDISVPRKPGCLYPNENPFGG